MTEPMDEITKQAEQDAADLLATAWTGRGLPVDPVKIARSLGVQAFAAQLDKNVSGVLIKQLDRDPTIILNELDSENRKRFSCAHELGHFVRRTNSQTEDSDQYEWVDFRGPLASQGENVEEVYANKFAAALLMPAEQVRDHHRSGKTPVEMAFIFEVSGEAMKNRLTNLRLK